MSSSAFEVFTSSVNPIATRIEGLPSIVLVFGGPLGEANASARQMFLNWLLAKRHPINTLARTPEQFQDWNNFEGYGNLIDFERDAACLAKAIVLFSESAGSFAELGAFCMDNILAERLFVVISSEYYNAGSFIAHGPIKKIEHHHAAAICVVDSIKPDKIEAELEAVAQELNETIINLPKSIAFEPSRERDQFLLAADLVELFGALTIRELRDLMMAMGVDLPMPRLQQVVKQLERFELIECIEKLTKRYLVSPYDRRSYLNYESKKEEPPFDRARFKFKHCIPWLKKDTKRKEAYLAIHPKELL